MFALTASVSVPSHDVLMTLNVFMLPVQIIVRLYLQDCLEM